MGLGSVVLTAFEKRFLFEELSSNPLPPKNPYSQSSTLIHIYVYMYVYIHVFGGGCALVLVIGEYSDSSVLGQRRASRVPLFPEGFRIDLELSKSAWPPKASICRSYWVMPTP